MFVVGGHFYPRGYHQCTVYNPVGSARSLQTPYSGNDQGKILLLRSWPFMLLYGLFIPFC